MQNEYDSKVAVVSADYLKKLMRESEEYLNLAKSIQAEFINYQDRLKRDKQQWSKYLIEALLKDLLPVLDLFEASINSLKNSSKANDMLEGIKLIEKELLRVLSKHGVSLIEIEGKTFDPQFHEAVEVVETKDHSDKAILKVVKRGYLLHDKVLRAAQVVINKRS